jgi:DNA polymerase I-like protein with 3'-5' exonuclease and polymerase domains
MMVTIVNLHDIHKYLDEAETIFFDTETQGLYGEVLWLQLYQEHMQEPIFIRAFDYSTKEIREELIKKPYKFVTYNGLYDWECLGFTKDMVPVFDDCYLLAKLYLIDCPSYDLYSVVNEVLPNKFTDIKYIDKKAMQKSDFRNPTEEQFRYMAYDVKVLPDLFKALWALHMQFPGYNYNYFLDLRMARRLLDVHKVGLPINKALVQIKLDELKVNPIPVEVNVNSHKQVSELLGIASADKYALTDLAMLGDSKISQTASNILKERERLKSISYLESLLNLGNRAYGKFNVIGAVSGRMSCNNINLQQIPREFRECFSYPEDDNRCFVIADFSQIELRLAATLWDDPAMREAYDNGIDIHSLTAAKVNKIDIKYVTKQQRQIAKSMNFGLLYGIGAATLQKYIKNQVGIDLPLEDVASLRYNWLGIYEGVKKRHKLVAEALAKAKYGVVGKTGLGRKYRTSSYTQALNIQVQGSGAELLKLLVFELPNDLSIANLIHDEVIVDTTKNNAKEVAEIIKEKMALSWQDYWKLASDTHNKKFNPVPLTIEEPIISQSISK